MTRDELIAACVERHLSEYPEPTAESIRPETTRHITRVVDAIYPHLITTSREDLITTGVEHRFGTRAQSNPKLSEAMRENVAFVVDHALEVSA